MRAIRVVSMLAVTLAIVALTVTMCGTKPSPAATSIQNLRAFAKLYGYVRWFHPSDEAAALDWDAFAIFGAERVKEAETPEDLRRLLEELFEPVAPTVQIFPASVPAPPLSVELVPVDADSLQLVAWQHLGMGSGTLNSVYRSIRLNRPQEVIQGASTAVLTQGVDVEGLRGREVRFTGRLRADEPGAAVQLWLRVDLTGVGRGLFDNMADRPVTVGEWTEVTIQGPVADDASGLFLGALCSDGACSVDDLRLEVRNHEGEPWTSAGLLSGGFEGDWPGAWATPTTPWSYTAEGGSGAGGRFLRIEPRRVTFSGPLYEFAPSAGEVVEKPLGRGLMARIPLALFSRAGHTLGSSPSGESGEPPNGLETLSAALEDLDLMSMTAGDEALRLGDVVMAWNVFQHFYPYFDVIDTDWDAVLTEGLTRALSDPTDSEPTTEGFLGTLRWMVAQLHDGHGRVSGPTDPQAGFPIRLGWIEDQVVVVASGEPETFRVGDVLLTLDGEPATQRLEELARTISGSTQWKRWRALNTLTLGPAGSEATLELEREGGEVVTITRIRDSGDVPAETGPSNVAELEPGFFYVNLDRVTMEEFDARVEELAVARGVIFDLRGYPNGNHLALTHLSDEPLRSAYWRVPQIIYPDHEPGPGGELHYAESRWNLPPREPRFQGRIAFITDGRAISYAESVMGIVEHYGLGEIVGQTTAGANGNVNPFILPGRYRFSWTGMQVIKHDGSQHHLVGIHPTVPATRTIQGVREGRDELLERALEVVSGG